MLSTRSLTPCCGTLGGLGVAAFTTVAAVEACSGSDQRPDRRFAPDVLVVRFSIRGPRTPFEPGQSFGLSSTRLVGSRLAGVRRWPLELGGRALGVRRRFSASR